MAESEELAQAVGIAQDAASAKREAFRKPDSYMDNYNVAKGAAVGFADLDAIRAAVAAVRDDSDPTRSRCPAASRR